jgi:serine protease inhibitor
MRASTSRRTPRALLALTLCAAAAACNDGTGPSGGQPEPISSLPRTLTGVEQEAIRASNDFGLSLLGEVAAAAPGENVVLSPLSASIALGMAYAGATDLTADSMRQTLGWGNASRADVLAGYRDLPALIKGLDPQVQFLSANALWVRNGYPVLPAYTSEMQQVFSATVRNGDFGPATVADMNSWASTSTNGRIPKVVESLGDDLVAMLMNALYFKGNWRDRFDPARTQSRPFRTSAGAQPSVPMMARDGDMSALQSGGTTWVELPYGNTAFVMTLALPPEGTPVRDWVRAQTEQSFSAAVSSLRGAEVDLLLPKFRLENQYSLTDPLKAMGMRRAFDRDRAEFGGIGPGQLFLSFVKQNVFIDVNEEGTEAAAVTQVGVGTVSVPLRLVAHFDRPFAFFIRERLSGTILFAGVIEQPAS